MNQASQKALERDYVKQTEEILGKKWEFADHEAPDFIVTEGERKFGLEVCQIFAGAQGRKGSQLKQEEAENQGRIDAYRRKWEEKTGAFLRVSLVDATCDKKNIKKNMKKNMEELLRLLDEKRFSEKPDAWDERIEVFPHPSGPALLTAYVMRVPDSLAYCAQWFSVNDRTGWVGDASGYIDRMIEVKSTGLPRYRENADLDDVRLLIVADRRKTSGMLELQEPRMFDPRGFREVYFLSYPISVHRSSAG